MSSGKISTSVVLEGDREYKQAVKNIQSAQKELRSEMKLLTVQFKEAANSEEALKAKNDILTKQISETEKKIELLSSRVKDYKQALEASKANVEEMVKEHGKESQEAKAAQAQYDELTRKLKYYETELNNSKVQLADQSRELTKNEKYLKEAAESADKCATSIDKFGKETKEAGEKIETTNEALEAFAQNEVFKAFEETAEKIAEALGECVEAADQFEYSMTKVQSIAQVDDSTLSGMGEEIQELAVTYGASANEIAEATYQAISASVDAGEATDFVANAMKLARGGFTDTVTAVDVLTTTLNAYGKEANTTEHIMDALVTTQNLGKTTVGELAQNLGQVIPTAAGLNVSLDNLSAAYIQLTKNGVNTANSTTYINGMLTELSDNGSKVGKTLKKETGQSFGELMASGKSLGDVIQILGEHVNGNSEAFLNMFGNVRAARGALTIFNNGADAFNASLEAIGDSAGAANKAFEIMADTSEMTNKRMEAATENLKVSIGEALLPTFDKMKEAGIGILEPLTDFVEKNPQIVSTLAGTAAAVVGVTTAITACTAAVSILRVAFGDLSGAAAILGTAAVAGGIIGLTTSTKSAAFEVQALADEVKRTASSMDEIDESYTAQAQTVDNLAGKVRALQAVEGDLSDTQKTEMVIAVKELNRLFPELGLEIDDTTGKVKDYTSAIDENIDALIEEYKWQLKQKEAQEIIEKIVELEEKQAVAEEKLAEAKQKVRDIAGTRDATAEINDLDRAQAKYDELTRKIESCKDEYGELIQETKGATEASEEFAEEQDDVAESTGMSEDALEELAKKYEKARESAVSSLQSQKEKFQELGEAARKGAEQSGESIDQFAQRIADQRKGIEEYSGNVEKALEFMLDNKWSEGLFSTIIQQGPEASGDLKLLLDTIEEGEDGVKKLKETCEDFDAFAPMSEQVGEIQAKLETGIPITEEAIKKNQELIDSQGNVVHAYEDGHAAYKTHIETMEELAESEPTAVAEAVTATASQVSDAETQMLTDAINDGRAVLGMEEEGSESTVFKGMGETIVSSFAAGLADEGGLVSQAMQGLVNAAINSVDLSAISEKLAEITAKAVGEAEQNLSKVVSDTNRQSRMTSSSGGG